VVSDPRITAAASGDRTAAESLCRELLPRVRNLVRYLVRGDARVDDIAQEALIAVLRGLATYRGDGRFEAWVDRVVARSTFAALRRLRAEIPPRPRRTRTAASSRPRSTACRAISDRR
jgi:RNA polymerase sigma-70 factor (ECF subfamily)